MSGLDRARRALVRLLERGRADWEMSARLRRLGVRSRTTVAATRLAMLHGMLDEHLIVWEDSYHA